jgi:hypothetical protein
MVGRTRDFPAKLWLGRASLMLWRSEDTSQQCGELLHLNGGMLVRCACLSPVVFVETDWELRGGDGSLGDGVTILQS